MRNRYEKYNNAITNTITEDLQELSVSKELSIWFTENEMMTNAEKFHLLLSSFKDHKIENNGLALKILHCEKLLHVMIN